MEFIGESSCKGREDGDDSCSERPLKKARYAWQVKGKHHLKNDKQDHNMSSPVKGDSQKIPKEPENNITLCNNVESLLDQECHTIECVANSENSLLTPNHNLEKYICPKYISSHDRIHNAANSSSIVLNNRESQMPDIITEDQCIAQWQARQMVKGCVDNTINRLLEMWPQVPITLDFAEFINHLPGDNTIENEGILMAISAHGLQNTPSSSNSDTNRVEDLNVAMVEIPPLPSLSPLPSSEDNQQNNIDEKSTDESENSNDETYPYFSEELPYPFLDDTQNLDNNENDFMNAAVLFAIKSKGLTASGTDYG